MTTPDFSIEFVREQSRYSLQGQAAAHLGLHLDKGGQRSDWSRRPLDARQVHYAALDAFSTLLLYENQITRRLSGTFQLKPGTNLSQAMLPLEDAVDQSVSTSSPDTNVLTSDVKPTNKNSEKEYSMETEFPLSEIVLMGIIVELPTRYHPDQLAVSVGSQRVGLAGLLTALLVGMPI